MRASLVWLIGCGTAAAPPAAHPPAKEPPPRPVVAAPVPPIRAVIAPQGGPVRVLAVVDDGSAALTADDFGQVRLWPALDGSREPIVVRANAPRQLALARDGEGLLAIVLDAAGGLELVRLDRNAAAFARASIAPDPPFVELAAIAGGVLARRSDHAIVRVDATGAVRGILSPAPGEQIRGLAVRGAFAVAAIARDLDTDATAVRRIDLDGELRWGETIALPLALAAIAISPSGKRATGFSTAGELALVTLAPTPAVVSRTPIIRPRFGPGGFLDDNHVLLARGDIVAWGDIALRGKRIETIVTMRAGDRRAVGARSSELVIGDASGQSYLGYRSLVVTRVERAGEHGFAMYPPSHDVVWLDARLRPERSVAAADGNPVTAVDDRHVLISRTTSLLLRDATTGADREVAARWVPYQTDYDPVTHVLAQPRPTELARLALDIEHGTTTPMRPLAPTRATRVFTVDPALADGVIAIGFGLTAGRVGLDYYVDTPGLDPVPIDSTDAARGRVLGVSRNGRVYLLAPQGLSVAWRHHAEVTIPLPDPQLGGAIDRDGRMVVIYDGKGVTALEADGTARWHRPVLDTRDVAIAADGATVLLATLRGLVAVDAATGQTTATSCGWHFELAPAHLATSFDRPPICGDD